MTNLNVLILAELLKKEIDNIKQLKGAKLSYAIIKNIDVINDYVSIIQKKIEPTEEHRKYEEERISLCEKFCKKNELNELITITKSDGSQEYDIDINDNNWIESLNLLKKKYEKCIQDRNLQIESYNSFLNEQAEIKLHMISLDIIPDTVTVEIMDILKNFIIE